jgi:DNA-binding transcriptional LysR family regulator
MSAEMQDKGNSRWDDIRIFLASYRNLSLGAAALRLGVDTSTVSRRLTALEEVLGVRLFERTRSGLLPTHAAELVLPAAEAMEAAHGRLTRDASELEGIEGKVRISAAPGLADSFLAPSLVRLREQYPEIRIELDVSVRPLDLSRYEADIALRSVRPQGAELIITKIASSGWVAACAPCWIPRLQTIQSWSEVPWIAWDIDMDHLSAARWINHHVDRNAIVLKTSHFSSQLGAAEAGMGLLLVPKPYVYVRKLDVVPVVAGLQASAAHWPSDSLWLVSHRALHDVPRVKAVWNFFANELRQQLGGSEEPAQSEKR